VRRRKLYNEELHDMHFPHNIIKMIKSLRMIRVGYVAHTREKRN
jgi:hypothetical protein